MAVRRLRAPPRAVRALLTLALAALLPGCGAPSSAGVPCDGCNLVLVSVDTLRADHMSLYGYERPTTPHLETLASDAVVFDEFVNSGGWTLASHMSMFTSLYPRTHRVLSTRAYKGRPRLPDARVTLAEVLSDAGHASAAFVDALWMRAAFGFDQGFDLYDQKGGGVQAVLPRALAWIDDHRAAPFFLFLHIYDVHSKPVGLPYGCPGYLDRYAADRDGYDGCEGGRCASNFLLWVDADVKQGHHRLSEWIDEGEMEIIEGLYDGCINFVDDHVAELVDHLKQLGIYDRTLLAITSDHGEQFGEHGSVLHGHDFEESVRIPLLLKLPGQAYAGRRVGALATTIDLMPTLLAVLGRSVPEEGQGVNLLPAVRDGDSVRSTVLLDAALRTDRNKYFPETGRLYDLAGDPAETEDAAGRQPELAERLDEAFREQSERTEREGLLLGARGPEKTGLPELDEDERAQLEALGYAK